jgi:protein-disulfide isomerase
MFVALLCMVVMTTAVAQRQFFPAKAAPALADSKEVPDWEEHIPGGTRIGSATAAVTILEFADFQCPACRRFAVDAWPRLRRKYGDEVALVYRHWPLSYHKAAYSAAIASDCAAIQGRFESFHDVLFEQQDSIGQKAMARFAHEAGVPNIDQFEACASHPGPLPTIEDDIAAARKIGGRGTPTLIINGTLYPFRSDSTWLPRLVDSLMALPRKGPRL